MFFFLVIIIERFEPGETREAFDIDFAEELIAEKKQNNKKGQKRQRTEEVVGTGGEESDVDEHVSGELTDDYEVSLNET